MAYWRRLVKAGITEPPGCSRDLSPKHVIGTMLSRLFEKQDGPGEHL